MDSIRFEYKFNLFEDKVSHWDLIINNINTGYKLIIDNNYINKGYYLFRNLLNKIDAPASRNTLLNVPLEIAKYTLINLYYEDLTGSRSNDTIRV